MKMKAKVVYLVDCDYLEDYENYHFNIGIFTSFTNAESAVMEDVNDKADKIIDTTEETTKNGRQFWTYYSMKGTKYYISEYALNTGWDRPIEKEYIKED
jgi:hypothetical protein